MHGTLQSKLEKLKDENEKIAERHYQLEQSKYQLELQLTKSQVEYEDKIKLITQQRDEIQRKLQESEHLLQSATSQFKDELIETKQQYVVMKQKLKTAAVLSQQTVQNLEYQLNSAINTNNLNKEEMSKFKSTFTEQLLLFSNQFSTLEIMFNNKFVSYMNQLIKLQTILDQYNKVVVNIQGELNNVIFGNELLQKQMNELKESYNLLDKSNQQLINNLDESEKIYSLSQQKILVLENKLIQQKLTLCTSFIQNNTKRKIQNQLLSQAEKDNQKKLLEYQYQIGK